MIDLKVLDEEIEKLLVGRGVRSLDSYCFNSPEDQLYGYSGYEMWNLTPPYEEDHEAWQSRAKPKQAASENQQRLMVIGEDFQALLKAARYAIGCALLHREGVEHYRPLPSPFEFHEISALMLLGSAIDRLRDFLIAVGLGQRAHRGKESKQITQALRECEKVAPDDVAQLRQIIAHIQGVKLRRNDVVHEIALEFARVQNEFLKDESRAFAEGGWPPYAALPDSPEEYSEWIASSESSASDEIETRVVSLEAAYAHLVRAGGLAFRVEIRLREEQL